MLNLFNSSSLTDLADACLNAERDRPFSNPLLPESYVVQNHGMERWLSLFVAEREGIVANKQFKFPAELYWQLMRSFKPDIPDILPSERQPMTWSIFHILQHDEDPQLAKLQRYVGHGDPEKTERRCWSLARRIGDVFDQYLTYRPEMLMAWERKKHMTRDDSERWQIVLWNKLRSRWQDDVSTRKPHRARLHQQLCQALDEGTLPADKLPHEITIFGVSEMPPAYLQAFLKCANSIDVNLYRVEVSQNMANSLVKSFGNTGREFKELIWETARQNKTIDCEQIKIKSSFNPKDSETLFRTLRDDLITNESNRKRIKPDQSFRIHACHSPRREVEVLYDQLLEMLDDDETLMPSDIQVLCPQMDQYGGHIQSVFGASEPDVPYIPFHLGENSAASNPIFVSFLKLLQLLDSRFKVTDVIDFIDVPVIKQSCGFSEDDMETFQRWIDDAGIRWGINGRQKRDLDLPANDRYTWESGLHQMFAGYALENEPNALFSGLYPYPGIQDSEYAHLLGELSRFLHQLFKCHRQVQKSRNPKNWARLLQEWVDCFFSDTKDYAASVSALRCLIKDVVEQTGRAKFEETVSFQLMRSHLQELIKRSRTGGGRPGQGVTFSGMIAMRNIPARVICMIGMNDGSFPRSTSDVSFDLIKKNPQKGDRQPSRDDRQLFLETITAARDKLYLSYVGQSNKKELDFPPSVVLQELLDYISEKYEIDPKELVHKHKLHAFSPAYFKNDKNNLTSYSVLNRNVAQALYRTVLKNKPFVIDDLPEWQTDGKAIPFENLISFFQHPSKYFLQTRLGIYVYEDDVLDEDQEGFELNALQKYTIGQELFDRYTGEHSIEDYERISFARNELPEGWPGKQFFKAEQARVEAFGKIIAEAGQASVAQKVAVDFAFNKFKLTGTLDNIYANYQLLYRLGRGRAKDFITFWIRHVIFQMVKSADHPGTSVFYTIEKEKKIYRYELTPVLNAEDILKDLVAVYQKGLQNKTLFFTDTSFAFAKKKCKKGESKEKSIEAAQAKWHNPDSSYAGEGKDPYNKRVLQNMNPLEYPDMKKEFMQKSISFWRPYFNHLTKKKVS